MLYLIAHEVLDAKQVEGRWWIEADSVRVHADLRKVWISYASAANLARCSRSAIDAAVKAGEIIQRDVDRCYPSLDRASVIAFGRRWHRRRRAEAKRRAANQASPPPAKPDGEHEWLAETAAATRLGMTRSRVGQLAREERLPSTNSGGRRWYRGDHIDQIASARKFRADMLSTRQQAPTTTAETT